MKKPIYLISLLSLLFFFSCTEKDQTIAGTTKNNLQQRVAPQKVYTQFVILDVLNNRLITNFYTLALINNNLDLYGFNTDQNPDYLVQQIENDLELKQCLTDMKFPLGPGGPIGPIPLPCSDSINELTDGNPENFLEFNEEKLMEIYPIILHICEPKIEINSPEFNLVSNEAIAINDVSITQNNEVVGVIIDVFQDEWNQTNFVIQTDFENEATLTLNFEICGKSAVINSNIIGY